MPRPKKYATEAERLAAQRAQKAASEHRRRRKVRGLDELIPIEGEAATGAKVTEDQVREIRKRYREQGLTISTLARLYSLSEGAVSDIINRRTWKNVE